MIKILEGFPEGVVAFAAQGRVTKKDYDDDLIPKVKKALEHHDKIRCYYDLGLAFEGMDAGAMWEDLSVGLKYLSRWERVAVVTDEHWIRMAMNLFHFLVPGDIRVFGTSQAREAKEWISAE